MIDFNEPVAKNCSGECECGRPKTKASNSCRSCAFLDGATDTTALVIDAIRCYGHMSVRELCEAIYGEMTHNKKCTITDTLRRLERNGRARRYWREGDPAAVARRGFGRTGLHQVRVSSCWAYALDERRVA